MEKSGLQTLTSILEVVAYAGAFLAALGGLSYIVANRQLQRVLRQEADAGRQKSEISRLETQRQIATAESGMAEANERAEDARATAASAYEGQKRLEVQAEQLRKEQEQVRKQNLELQAQVEKERPARLQLERLGAQRHLTEAQRTRMLAALTAVPSQTVKVVDVMSSAESAQYADQLTEVLAEAGWKVPPENRQHAMFSPTAPVGVLILTKDARQAPPAAEALARALTDARINFQTQTTDGVPAGTVELRIGVKP